MKNSHNLALPSYFYTINVCKSAQLPSLLSKNVKENYLVSISELSISQLHLLNIPQDKNNLTQFADE